MQKTQEDLNSSKDVSNNTWDSGISLIGAGVFLVI
jgi:hypothetical protein